MNGNRAVLDSNFLIYISKGLIDLNRLYAEYDALYVSIITYIEVYGFNFDDANEKAILDNVFAFVDPMEVDLPIAEKTIEYRRDQNNKIKLPDALILAAAQSIGADLITNNLKDFENVDPTVNLVGIERFKL